jgi:CRISPR-associated protein (TIGR03986 family)
MKGVVKNKVEDRGFGFITSDDDRRDYFFHFSDLQHGLRFDELQPGDRVEFELVVGEKGPKAVGVHRAGGPAAASPLAAAPRPAAEKPAAAPRQNAAPSPRDNYRFLNPYNFVRFLPAPSEPAEDDPVPVQVAKTLLSRCPPPPHDRYVGLSGSITCRLKALSPLFVSDAHDVTKGEAGADPKHKSYRFFRLGDQFAIPGSSLRGMVRSIFEAVTGSCLMRMTDSALSRHVFTSEAKRLWPARLESHEGGWRVRILNGTSTFDVKGLPGGEPQAAAWIMQYPYGLLQPSPTVRYAPRTAYAARVPVAIPAELQHGDFCHALIEPMQRPDRETRQGKLIRGFPFWNVLQVAKEATELPTPRGDQKCVSGWLCITNHNIENKHDERLFFTQEDPPRYIDVQEEVVRAYVELVRDYQERHQPQVQKRKDPSIPEAGHPAFSRFIIEKGVQLQDALLYASLEKTPRGTRVEFLAPVSVPRVAYETSRADLLRAFQNGRLVGCHCANDLCPACRTFGWVHPTGRDVAPGEQTAYRGRVRFSHALCTKPAGEPFSATLAILSAPKPTTVGFYLLHADGSSPATWTERQLQGGYDGDVELRGRKTYRRPQPKDLQPRHAGKHEYERIDGRRDDQNRTVRDVLPEGNEFEFTVDFDNLSEIELGALLWSLSLERDWAHRLGYAKPLGFGAVQVAVQDVRVRDAARRYRSLATEGVTAWDAARAGAAVQCFQNAMQHVFGTPFADLPNVRDLHALLGPPDESLPPMHYPRSEARPDPDGKNFQWFMQNKRAGFGLPFAADDREGLPLL